MNKKQIDLLVNNIGTLERIKKKGDNIFESIDEYEKNSLLRSVSVANLKEICRNRGIKGYSGKAKAELIKLLLISLQEEEINKLLIEFSETIKEIAEFKEAREKIIRERIAIFSRGEQLLKVNPNNILALYYNGMILIKFQEFHETLRYFDIIIEKYPTLKERTRNKLVRIIDVFTTKGEILIKMGRLDEALKHLDRSMELSKIYNLCIEFECLQLKAEIYEELNDEDGQLEVYVQMDEYSLAHLKIGTILVNKGKFDEAKKILKNMRGCESNDTLWAPALLQLARTAAIQNEKEQMVDYLKEAMRTTIIFMNNARSYSKQQLIEDIEKTPEFDRFRRTEEFQFIFNFNWELEDEIELANRIEHCIKEKEITPEQLNRSNLNLINYLCEYSERDIYLRFNLDQDILINDSKSIVVVANNMLDQYIEENARYYKGSHPQFSFHQEKLEKIEYFDNHSNISHKDFSFKEFAYDKDDIETALKIIKNLDEILIPERLFPLILKNLRTKYPYNERGGMYKRWEKRKSYDYSILIYPIKYIGT